MVSPAVTSTTANRKKRLLLVDSTPSKRDLRARVLRQMGVEVDCAADISEARSLWQADSYNLVLLDVRREPENVEAFCSEIQDSKTPQRIAYLVGKPEYLGALPGIESELAEDVSRGKTIWSEVVASLFIDFWQDDRNDFILPMLADALEFRRFDELIQEVAAANKLPKAQYLRWRADFCAKCEENEVPFWSQSMPIGAVA